jgi:hypothetical protein
MWMEMMLPRRQWIGMRLINSENSAGTTTQRLQRLLKRILRRITVDDDAIQHVVQIVTIRTGGYPVDEIGQEQRTTGFQVSSSSSSETAEAAALAYFCFVRIKLILVLEKLVTRSALIGQLL